MEGGYFTAVRSSGTLPLPLLLLLLLLPRKVERKVERVRCAALESPPPGLVSTCATIERDPDPNS